MTRSDPAGIRQVEFVPKLFVVAPQIAHEREEVGMVADRAEMRVILKRAMIRQSEFRGTLDLGDRFFGFAAERENFRSGVNHVMEMKYAAF